MAEYKCEICNREFATADALATHNRDKHHQSLQQTPKDKKKPLNWILILIVLGIVLGGFYLFRKGDGQDEIELDVILSNESLQKIPQGAVHWHPQLTIKIDGKEQSIPVGIGINVGKIVDTGVSGMRMSPTHTHESDGTIHLENNNPSAKPETLTLGYFFYVWNKKFNKDCIFEYCIDKGELKMYVNGKENFEYQNYLMQDNDQIVIEYASRS